MPISKIPEIKVNGSNQLFGGYIYSLDFDAKLAPEGSSTCSISVISESGGYAIDSSKLSASRVSSITVGGTTYQMYLRSYRISRTPSGRVLELEYMDGSFVLDKKFVGLHKKHGINSSAGSGGGGPTFFGGPGAGPPFGGGTFFTRESSNESSNTGATQFGTKLSCMIIVGKEKHPCDRNNDGNVDSVQDIADPCHPCNPLSTTATADARQAKVGCQEEIKYGLLQVDYNFTELLDKLGEAGFKIDSAKDPNPKFRADYTGSVRDVLSTWCNDFGWTFYWENGTIKFRDLRSVTEVNAQVEDFCENLESDEESYTLEGTVQTAVISNYARPGRGKEETACRDAMHFNIAPYNQGSWGNGAPLGLTKEIDEIACGFAAYSAELRGLYYWFIKHRMGNLNSFAPGKIIKELGVVVLSNAIRLPGSWTGARKQTKLDKFSQLSIEDIPEVERDGEGNIVPFLDATFASSTHEFNGIQDAIEANEEFKKCFDLLNIEDQWKMAEDMGNKFFFVAHYDQSIEGQYFQEEQSYAQGFLGKYHIFNPNAQNKVVQDFFEDYTYVADSVCGKRVYRKDGTLNFQAIDVSEGEMTYYTGLDDQGKPNLLASLPFAQFLSIYKDSDTFQQRLPADFKLVVISKQGNDWYPATGGAKRADPNESYQPLENVVNQDLISAANSYYPIPLGTILNEDGQNALATLLGDNPQLDKKGIQIFMGSLGGEFTFTRTAGANPKTPIAKPFNGSPRNQNNTNDPKLQQELVYDYPHLKCLPIGNITNAATMNVLNTPIGQFKFNSPSNSTYGIVIEKTKAVRQKIPKVETVMQSGKCADDNVLSFDVKSVDITDQTITDIKKGTSGNASTCAYDLNTIQKVHEGYAANMQLVQNKPLVSKSFTIMGIGTTTPSIGDGFQGMKISLTDEGVKTTYTFGTTMMRLPNRPELNMLGTNLISNRSSILGNPISTMSGGGTGSHQFGGQGGNP